MTLCKRSNIFIKVNPHHTDRFAVTREDYNSRYYDMFIISSNFVSYEYLAGVGPMFEAVVDDYGSVEVTRYRPCHSVKCSKLALLELFLFYLHTRRNFPEDLFTSKFNRFRTYEDATNLFDFVGLLGVNLYSHAISLEHDFHYICHNAYTTHRVPLLMKDIDHLNVKDHPNVPLVRFVADQWDAVLAMTQLNPEKRNCMNCYGDGIYPYEKTSFVDVGPDMEETVLIPSTLKAMIVDKRFVVLPYAGKCMDPTVSVSYMVFVLTNIMYACSGNTMVLDGLVGAGLLLPMDLDTFIHEYPLDKNKFNIEDYNLAKDYRDIYRSEGTVPIHALVSLCSRYLKIVTSVHAMYISRHQVRLSI